MTKKKLDFEWCESTVLDALQPYTREIMEQLAELTGQPGILGAFVSDESSISDFLSDREETGRTSPHPFHKDKVCKIVTADTPKNREIVKRLSEALDVEIGVYDYLYEVAIRLRDA